jgi:ribose/xylose/arabinose/galactoside ABC-type transport system permease subunit/ABC-type sugar transport system substrate-binding protein
MSTLNPPSLSAAAQSPALADRAPIVQPQQMILAGLLAFEILVFAVIGTNFLSSHNFLEVSRQNVELGLLALALTPVIVTGGIDLSVGSLLGLCAVLFGKMWRDGGLSPAAAGVATVGIGGVAGLLNGLLITRLRIPPLIVTLGSFSLFRGLAEGITGGYDNFTGFPQSFLSLGGGSIFGGVPTQVPILLLASVAFWLLLHRSTIGRALTAIGFAPEGARHAGIPVDRRVALVYVLSGLMAGLAAVIYVSRVGQAKADAGMGYELLAITAVVLGGTSIFGGRGSVVGTIMGLFAIAILQNGMRLSEIRPELAGILTGVLLLVAIGIDWPARHRVSGAASGSGTTDNASEELDMKNSQLAVLCAVILAAALIVVGGNFVLVKSLQQQGGGIAHSPGGAGGGGGKQTTIAMMPKSLGNAYFIAAKRGAEDAAKELGVKLIWDGPTDPDPAKQNEIVETWVTQGVDVIAVACENRDGIASALRKAKSKGIKVLTYDADTQPDARDFFVNQATPEGIGHTLMDTAAKVMGNKGKFAIITASLTASNMNEWKKHITARLAEKYPDIQLVDYRPCDDKQDKAFSEANTILNKYPDVKLIMAICSPAVPGAAEAVKQSGRGDVKVIGLGLPNDNKPYVHSGITQAVILWNTMDLGYLTVLSADALAKGTLKPGATSIDAGRVGKVEIKGDNILLGVPFVFTKENIDRFDF